MTESEPTYHMTPRESNRSSESISHGAMFTVNISECLEEKIHSMGSKMNRDGLELVVVGTYRPKTGVSSIQTDTKNRLL
jgi:hypothetical protein